MSPDSPPDSSRDSSSDPLYTVSFPEVPAHQLHRVQAFRARHDPHHAVVAPHFTLVFGVRGVPSAEYLEHVAVVARAARPIGFACRYAMLGADDIDDTAYVFLVPDEGNSEISRLHDRLYRGPLDSFLRLEFPYVPHVTIGATKDFGHAKALCDEINAEGFCLEGRIASLTSGRLSAGRFEPLATFPIAP